MAYCPQCGEALDEGARFCAECGASVASAKASRGAEAAGVPAPRRADACSDEAAEERAARPAKAASASAPAVLRASGRARSAGEARRAPEGTAVMPRVPDAAERAADATRAMDALAPAGGVRPVTGPVAVGSGASRHRPPVAVPQASPVGSRRPVTYSARNTVRKSRVPLVLGLVVAAVLVGVGGFAAVTAANRADEGADAPATSFLPGDEAADAPAHAAPSPEPEAPREPATAERLPAAEADPQAAASLTSFYGGLPALDAKVGEAAQEFNGLYLSGSPEERRAALDRCEELRADIAEARDEVRALGIPDASPYHGCAEDIASLYEDLYQRIDVIIRSWEIDVGFDDPAGHSDEICAPMAAANEGGVSRYLRDYQERYPGADPAKVDV